MRGDGRIFRRKVNGVESGPFWLAYYGPGRDGVWSEVRESADTTDREKAERLLRDRIAAVKAESRGGDPFVRPRRVTVNELLDSARADLEGKAYARAAISLSKNLRRLLGAKDARGVSWETIKWYQRARLQEKAQKGTIDKETALLVRAFRLGHESRRVSTVPRREPLLALHENARKTWIDLPKLRELLDAIRAENEDLADWCEWFAWTGMRNRETSTLSWDDLHSGAEYETLTVRVENAKIREARRIPIVGPLESIIERRKARKRLDCRLVFHSNARSFENPVGGLPGVFLRIWHEACAKVGLPMLPASNPKRPMRRVSAVRPYDLRRHAARNLRAAGVPESVCVAIMGQKTASMFRRYAELGVTSDAADAFRGLGEWAAAQKGERSKLAVGNFGNSRTAGKTDR